MVRQTAFILLVCMMWVAETLQAQYANTPMLTFRKPIVNVGIKAGFNSSMQFIDQLSLGGEELEGVQNNYKVGYFAAFFCRFNLKKHHFIQPELSYNVSKGSISIMNTLENSEFLPDNALIKTAINSFDMPILYGYKFVDVHPYGMAFFIGPKIAWTWEEKTKSEYSGFYQQEIEEKIQPFHYSAVVGLAVNVSNIFFDFRYEVGLHNLSESIVYNKEITEIPYNNAELVVKRRRNVMSFSVGVIF